MRKLIAWSNASIMFLQLPTPSPLIRPNQRHIPLPWKTLLMVKIAAVEKLNTELTEKLTDLEGRSRRDNIRILNLKESIEGSSPLKLFEEFIPKVSELLVMSITIDHTHQGYGAPTDGHPLPVIIKIHGQTLRFTPDIPPVVQSA